MADITNQLQAAAGSSGSAGPDIDPNFKQTVLLLHGDGTNGAQNNTFIDGSSNNFTITRTGNVTQGSFSPFSNPDGYWSNFFDGTDDRLTIADNAALRPGTSNFTIEAWVYRKAAGAAHTIFAKGASTPTGFSFLITSSDTLRFTDTSTDITSTGTVAANTWVHIAVVREGTGSNQLKLYINGVQDGTGTSSTNFNQTTEARIGENRAAADDFNGYISNFRYVIGTALYTTGFTPSTVSLTTTSQGATSSEVELLTCQSNGFLDNSTNAFKITPVNNVRVTSFSPFAPTSAYSASLKGGSSYFDGSGDILTAPNNANLDLNSTDYTIEGWVYPTNNTGYHVIVGKNRYTNVPVGGYIVWFLNLTILVGLNGNFSTVGTGAASVPLNAWTHFAVCGTSTATKIYLNGVEAATSATVLTNTSSQLLTIGDTVVPTTYPANYPFFGYISNLRIVKGTALYTSTFTPPTTPLTAITNTQLLCNFSNAGIFDNTSRNNLETVADAQIDTTTKKYGTGSMEFDGTGDWLKVPDSPDLKLGTGNFTIELWVYLASGDTGSNRGLVAKGGASTGWLISLNTTENVVFTYTTSTITSSGAINTNDWNHIAVVREGTGSNQTKIYINGTNDGTGTVSTNFTQTEIMYIGANRAAGDPMKGFIDDVRITKGIARYTANFTAPTKAFPDL